MKTITLLDDWYEPEDGRYYVIIRTPYGARHRLSFWCAAAAWAALNRLMRPVAGPKRR